MKCKKHRLGPEKSRTLLKTFRNGDKSFEVVQECSRCHEDVKTKLRESPKA